MSSYLYVFLDEGGKFDFSPGGTRYFTLTSVTKARPFQIAPIPVKKKAKAIEKAIKTTLTHMFPEKVKYRVLHHASKSSFGLQVADCCNWAIFRKWERGDTRSYDLISSRMGSEFEIFRTGRRTYYEPGKN